MALTPAYVKQIEEWLQWYNWNASQIEKQGVEQRLEFLEKGIRGAFIILAGLTYEVERVDIGKERAERARAERQIILPVRFM